MIFQLLILSPLVTAAGIASHFRCSGHNENDGKTNVEFEVNRQGLVEGVGYGSEVISILRIGKRAVTPPYRFQTMGATESNTCQPDPFGDRYLFSFKKLDSSEDETVFFHVDLGVDCAEAPPLHVIAKCDSTAR